MFQSWVLSDLSSLFSRFCLLETGGDFKDQFARGPHRYQHLAAYGLIRESNGDQDSFGTISDFLQAPDWYFGHLSYELKDQLEPSLSSSNPAYSNFPLFSFFVPEIVIAVKEEKFLIWIHEKSEWQQQTEKLQTLLNQSSPKIDETPTNIPPTPVFLKMDAAEYVQTFEIIRQHLLRGDIYELNYCIPFIAENCSINPYLTLAKIRTTSPAPFSCFYRHEHQWLISSSPERFLRKEQQRIFSQPIKGTIKRDADPQKDIALKSALANSEKEKAENVMIVDLVRNDLSKIAIKGSVKPEELFGIYAFPKVFQMISTISAEQKPGLKFQELIKALFPMGSMTGAPKISAMEIIEQSEKFRRGLFSGSVGYISPDGDFDFNVVIRSIFYDDEARRVLIPAGSAITAKSNAEDEYQECLLKAEAMLDAVKNSAS
ncbi:anthranilate synthase component I family protein [soil metagenome]